MKINQPELKRAQLETIYWWVDCEHRYHQLFKQDKEIDIKYQNTFYEFTNRYSVRRTIKGNGEIPVLNLLDQLYKNDFINKARAGEPNLIDNIDKDGSGKSIRSLLSKYATLINPKAYTMYDTRAVNSLKEFGGKRGYMSYALFYKQFLAYQTILVDAINDHDVEYYIGLCKKQEKPINIDIFKRRLTDKYLWVLNT